MTLLDQFLSPYHFNERHAVSVQATPARTFAAITEVTVGELPLFRLLFRLRALPATLLGRRLPSFDVGEPLVAWARRSGFLFLGELAEEELLFGLIGQPWRLGGRLVRINTAEEFAAFRALGYVKVATNFLLQSTGTDKPTRLSTETRIWAPDRVTWLKFCAYWGFIRFGSGLIRREWLASIKRRAEGTSWWCLPAFGGGRFSVDHVVKRFRMARRH